MKKIYNFTKRPTISATSTIVGKEEKNGPLGEYFDCCRDDTKFGMQTWELAESEMVRMAFDTVLKKSKLCEDDIDIIFAGDLINQCTSTSFGLIDKSIPYVGLYGACSTFAEGLMSAAVYIETGFADTAACATSSHFCTAERQFRFPIEYGCQRTPTAQYTVTGAASAILSTKAESPSGVYVMEALPGIVREFGIKDANNMGAAMAPATADTIARYFSLSGNKPSDFDMILTGDLGAEGFELLKIMMKQYGYEMGTGFNDCGLMIYDLKNQDVGAGGSGCGCAAAEAGRAI